MDPVPIPAPTGSRAVGFMALLPSLRLFPMSILSAKEVSGRFSDPVRDAYLWWLVWLFVPLEWLRGLSPSSPALVYRSRPSDLDRRVDVSAPRLVPIGRDTGSRG